MLHARFPALTPNVEGSVIRPLLRTALPAALALLAAAPLAAQRTPRRPTAAAIQRAVETITPADFLQRLGVIADDSMRGRDTPSPELDKTADYIAAEFARLGLRPGGDSGTFLQRYPIRRTQVDTGGFVMAMGRGAMGHWALGREVALLEGALPESTVTGPAVLMVGLPLDTARPFGDVDLRGAVVFHAIPLSAQMQQDRILATVMKAAAAGARAWVFLLNLPPQMIAGMAGRALGPQYKVPGIGGLLPLPLLLLRDSSAAEVLRAAGDELAAIRDTSVHTIHAMPGFTVTVSARQLLLGETSAPNVVGILEGSDPRLRNEYVVVTGHMDHVGVTANGRCTAAGADSICNGADDDGSGTIGVVELARAFAALTPRPRRSLIFVTVSGEERGEWGSAWYVAHPAQPLAQHVANLNLDMISRNWRDSIAVLGKEMSTLGEVANRMTQEHPELGMRLVDDPEHNRYFMQSDHYSFATRGVPVLFFFSATHPELHRPTDDLSRIDADKAARVLKMVFYVALDVANAAQRPVWDAAARQRVAGAGSR
jgi:hypothetical protein